MQTSERGDIDVRGLEGGIERISSKTVKAAPHSPKEVCTAWEFGAGSPYSCSGSLLLALVVSLCLARHDSCLIESKLLKTNFHGGYPHPVGYQLSLKPKLLLRLDLHIYCFILRVAQIHRRAAEVAAP